MGGFLKNGKIWPQNVPQRSENSKISKNPKNKFFQHILSPLSSIFTVFWYLWIFTPPSYILVNYLAVLNSSATFCTWGTLLGHNQYSIDIPLCKFLILLSSGLLVAFLVLEFKRKSFSNLVSPNDPKKVKKIRKCINFVNLAFDFAFMAFIGLWNFFGPKRPLELIFIKFNYENNLWTIFSNSWHCVLVKEWYLA